MQGRAAGGAEHREQVAASGAAGSRGGGGARGRGRRRRPGQGRGGARPSEPRGGGALPWDSPRR